MYMLLTIYAITNLNEIKWGTREVKTAPPPNAKDQATKGRTPTW